MARKSRRINNIKPSDQIQVSAKTTEVIPVAIYARLSLKNSGKDDEGAAIENQIEVCKEYIKEAPDLRLARVFMDNGWTGTNLNRPAFEEMMDAVRSGEIKAIVVRDLSRLGRNYQDTDGLLEVIFPQMEVRFISVKERLDTKDLDWNSDTLKVELQNLINDFYARDISRKIHTAFAVKRANKSLSRPSIPYGYKWNDDHSNIVPDEETADVVRLIFTLRLEGYGQTAIANKLNEDGIKTHYAMKGRDDKKWIPATIRDMLRNQTYVGDLIWGRSKQVLYKNIDSHKTPESEWIVIENMHEAIVSREVFNKVKELMTESRKKYQRINEESKALRDRYTDHLEGKVFCGDCGRQMHLKKYVDHKRSGGSKCIRFYYCRKDPKTGECSAHGMIQEKLEKIIMDVIRSHIEIAVDYDRLLEKLRKSHAGLSMEKKLNNELRSIQGKIHAIRAKRLRLYGDHAEGTVDDEEYSYAKGKYDKEYELLNSKLDEAVKNLNDYKETVSPENKWVSMLKNIEESDELTQSLADATIDRVMIYKGGSVEIRLKYQDVYELTDEYLEKLKEGA